MPFESALIGAQPEDGELRIWGIAHSGPAWLAPTWGGRSVVPTWTDDPIVHVTGPGQLGVRCAGKLVGAIRRGMLVDAMMDVFDSDWLPAMFAREREQVRAEHAALQARTSSPTFADHSLIGRIGQHMLRRAIQLVRGAGNGGMILFVDDEGRADGGGASRGLAGLRLKYRFNQDEPSRRYRTLLFQILERVAAATSKSSVGWSDFALDASPGLERLEQSVFELSRLIANLAAIDGAVVVDKRFALVGFGAEVSSELSSPPRVWRALDTEGERARARRHRERRHAPPRGLSLRARSPAGPGHRHLPRRRRHLRRQPQRRSRLLGAVSQPVASQADGGPQALPPCTGLRRLILSYV